MQAAAGEQRVQGRGAAERRFDPSLGERPVGLFELTALDKRVHQERG